MRTETADFAGVSDVGTGGFCNREDVLWRLSSGVGIGSLGGNWFMLTGNAGQDGGD